jgi:hypothetical protein
VDLFQDLVRQLARPEVDTFLTLPGLNSFYFWARKEPPTGLNTTAWMMLLDDTAQERIWQAANKYPGLMVVKNRALIKFWMKGRSTDSLPLVRRINENFTPMLTNSGYEMLIRRPIPAASIHEPQGRARCSRSPALIGRAVSARQGIWREVLWDRGGLGQPALPSRVPITLLASGEKIMDFFAG